MVVRRHPVSAQVEDIGNGGVHQSELVAPWANRFVGHGDASPSQQVFDVPVAQVEPMAVPDGVLDHLRGNRSRLYRVTGRFIRECPRNAG